MKKKILLSLSGGLDSCVNLAFLKKKKYDVSTVTFMYGARNSDMEMECAVALAQHYDIHNMYGIDVSRVFSMFNSSMLTNNVNKIPDYANKEENQKTIIVPSRNLIFVSIMSGLAESVSIPQICMGMNADDISPDCSHEAMDAMYDAVSACSGRNVHLFFPLEFLSKKNVIKLGLKYKAPFHLTRSCYSSGTSSCGKCKACVTRLKAFSELGIKDTIKYEEKENG